MTYRVIGLCNKVQLQFCLVQQKDNKKKESVVIT